MIKEPNLKKSKLKEKMLPRSKGTSPNRLKEGPKDSIEIIKPKKGFFKKLKKITSLIVKECKTNHAIIVCLYGNFLIKTT